MKKVLLFTIWTFLNFCTYGQIDFEPGYFIDTNNKKVECFIKNNDWKDNPQSFMYMLTLDGERREASVKQASEFGVTGKVTFVAARVNIDRSSTIVSSMSYKREPENTKELLFLRRLVDGEVDLYNYEAGNLSRFFYSEGESEIQQLVHKNYINQKNHVAENNQYRQQLSNDFGDQVKNVEKLGYNKADLINYFISLNEERGVLVDKNIQAEKLKKGVFHFSLMGGLTFRNLAFELSNTAGEPVDFGTNLNSTFGAEVEFVFPFNKNKWAAVLETSFNNYKSDAEIRSDGAVDEGDSIYKAIEVALGVRHYMFLNTSFRLFVNGFGTYFAIPATIVELGPGRSDTTISNTFGPGFGLGFDFKEKIGFELRYQHFGNIVVSNKTNPRSTNGFGGFSMILNYRLF
jgi:hypothetical protein